MNRQLSGLRAWVVQRASAVYLVAYLVGMGGYLVRHPAVDFAAWRELWRTPFVAVSGALLFLALLSHAWVGIRDVILDYVHRPAWRLVCLGLLWGWLLMLATWLFYVLITVGK